MGGVSSLASVEDRRDLDQIQNPGDSQVAIWILMQIFAQRPSYLLRTCRPTPVFLECLRNYNSVLWQILLKNLLGGAPILSEEGFRHPASQARLPIAHGGLSLLSTTVLAPTAFLGSFAIAACSSESQARIRSTSGAAAGH